MLKLEKHLPYLVQEHIQGIADRWEGGAPPRLPPADPRLRAVRPVGGQELGAAGAVEPSASEALADVIAFIYSHHHIDRVVGR